MKYSEQALWDAIYVYCPDYKIAKQQNVHLPAITAMNSAINLAFYEIMKRQADGNNNFPSWELACAQVVLYEAQKDIINSGQFTFGTKPFPY